MRLETRKVLPLVVLAVIGATCLLFSYLFFRTTRINTLRKKSIDFVAQVNQLGSDLNPGDDGKIVVPATDADELLMLPAFCSQTELQNSLPRLEPSELHRVARLSSDDRQSPSLVWLTNGRVVASFPAEFSTGVDLNVRVWKVRAGTSIKIEKEAESQNGFLSLRFLAD